MGRPYATPKTRIGMLIDQGLRQSDLLDQTRLAELCHVSKSYIAKLKIGKIRYPSESLLACMSAALNQDIDDYRLAALADHGDLLQWQKVLDYQVFDEVGVRLSTDDKAAIDRYVRVLIKQRKGKK